MSNELHPIFENIFKTIIKDKQQDEVSVPNTDVVVDFFSQDVSFENLETLRGFINEIKEHPNEVIATISKEADRLEEELVENEICPVCGNWLIYEHDSNLDTRVPYGDTYVTIKGMRLVCDCCGYRSEE